VEQVLLVADEVVERGLAELELVRDVLDGRGLKALGMDQAGSGLQDSLPLPEAGRRPAAASPLAHDRQRFGWFHGRSLHYLTDCPISHENWVCSRLS